MFIVADSHLGESFVRSHVTGEAQGQNGHEIGSLSYVSSVYFTMTKCCWPD